MKIVLNNIFLHSLSISALIIIIFLTFKILKGSLSSKTRYLAMIVILISSMIPLRPIIFELNNQQENIIPISSLTINNSKTIYQNTITSNDNLNIINYLMILWMLGFIIFITYNLFKYYSFIKTINRWKKDVSNPNVLKCLEQVKTELNLQSKNINVTTCSLISTPMLVGIKNPLIILPSDNYDQTQLYYILKHECIHYKQKDLYIKLFCLINQAIHWFNPLIYWFSFKINNECEKSCDELITKNLSMNDRKNYAESIVNTINTSRKFDTNLSTQFLGGAKDMKERLITIFEDSKANKTITFSILLCILVVTITNGSIVASTQRSESLVKNEMQTNPQKNTNTTEIISEQKAIDIALSHIKNASITEIELDIRENKYEIDLIKGNLEYSLEINATTGDIISTEQEIID